MLDRCRQTVIPGFRTTYYRLLIYDVMQSYAIMFYAIRLLSQYIVYVVMLSYALCYYVALYLVLFLFSIVRYLRYKENYDR